MISEGAPHWSALATNESRGPFYEVWYLKLNHATERQALWLKFTLLISANGFKKQTEVWAVEFDITQAGQARKTAIKQTFELNALSSISSSTETGIRIGPCDFTHQQSTGEIHAQGKSLSWNLTISPASNRFGSIGFDFVPSRLKKAKLVKNIMRTCIEDLRFTGNAVIRDENGERRLDWKDAPGMYGHFAGPRNAHAWTWGHCNNLVDQNGDPTSFVFDGLTTQSRIGANFRLPRLSTFLFIYDDVVYPFNSLWDALTIRSQSSLTGWSFRADRGSLSFQGEMKTSLKNHAGLLYEDTDGTFLYGAHTQLADLTILVYRNGKLENTFHSRGKAAFEVVSRKKNPYIAILV